MMNRVRAPALRVVLGSVVIAAAVGTGYAIAAQPHMDAALRALETAQKELQASEANKAGHREKAMHFVAEAIGEVRAGINAAR